MSKPVNTKLKPYFVFDRHIGMAEGVALVFAHNHREARKIGHGFIWDWFGSDTAYIDCGARLIKNPTSNTWMESDFDKLIKNEPHGVEDVTYCMECSLSTIESIDICMHCGSSRVNFSINRKRNEVIGHFIESMNSIDANTLIDAVEVLTGAKDTDRTKREIVALLNDTLKNSAEKGHKTL